MVTEERNRAESHSTTNVFTTTVGSAVRILILLDNNKEDVVLAQIPIPFDPN